MKKMTLDDSRLTYPGTNLDSSFRKSQMSTNKDKYN
jgi:hypothetical protein